MDASEIVVACVADLAFKYAGIALQLLYNFPRLMRFLFLLLLFITVCSLISLLANLVVPDSGFKTNGRKSFMQFHVF